MKKAVILLSTLTLTSCGFKEDSQTKIISGEGADLQPFMVSLSSHPDVRPFCGGTLVRKNVVLTAAHCVNDAKGQIYITLGSRDLPNPNHAVKATKVIVHPLFKDVISGFDIALLWFNPNNAIHTETVEIRSAETPRGLGDVFGWGNITSNGDVFSPRLQRAAVKFMDYTECGKKVDNDILFSQVCSISPGNRGEDVCFGDSGGPLGVKENGKFRQVGITSYGAGCAQPGKPSVYTNAPSFLTWIENTIKATENVSSREQEFNNSCYHLIRFNGEGGLEQEMKFVLTDSFQTKENFISKSSCGEFEIAQPNIDGTTLVRDTITGLVAPAKPLARHFTASCGNFALMNMVVSEKGLQGSIANNHQPFYINGEEESLDMTRWILDSSCELEESTVEVYKRTGRQWRAVRISGPNFPEIANKFYLSSITVEKNLIKHAPLWVKPTMLTSDGITIVNESDLVAHGLFFACPFPFSVRQLWGSSSVSSFSAGSERHLVALTTNNQPWAKVDNKMGKLRLKIAGVSRDKFMESCRLNGSLLQKNK